MSPYTKIETAEKLLLPNEQHVSSPELYLAWHLHYLSNTIQRWHCIATPLAKVEHGRWMTHCVHCHSGMLLHPEWKLACCITCGAVYSSVQFPAEYKAIESLLLERPLREFQNWFPGETVQTLFQENFDHFQEIAAYSALSGGAF